MQQWIKEVARGKKGSKDLDYHQTKAAAQAIVNGEATDAQIAAYLTGLRLKTESTEELLAFVHVFQENCQKLNLANHQIIDLACPYNGRNSYTGTIPAAILLAESGLPVFLHSSDSLPPKYGITMKAVLEEMGINVSQSASSIENTMDKAGIGFASTEAYCPSLGRLRKIREEMGIRTLVNTVEKLLNISQAETLMMGAFHRTAINKIAPLFKELPYKNVYIVQGMEGSEDLPVHRNSFIFKLSSDGMESFMVKPEDYGLLVDEWNSSIQLSAKEQSDISLALLSGERSGALSYYYHQVLFNVGIRYHLFGISSSIEEGIDRAKEQLITQKGLRQLGKWKASQS
ncbi:anthranilate phosphoribosyltransferase [Neobacillus sp. MM2021_6]|uniref:anthranilate phosphoribosyltransferase n=1 Tax=Bacillaceae TaxID=186817 RepID=UPI00140CC6C2|nr:MULTISPECIES: anthranilate phosphoribosyltransferase [Bacillaceae]MBO0960049.1 anthranilate phosphoribosyltransferase [Neobacillus sp. MM2021_6]NHC18629.1 anthranilate phosphoribosyltransferase [Bacillus sp. MM2020_4]